EPFPLFATGRYLRGEGSLAPTGGRSMIRKLAFLFAVASTLVFAHGSARAADDFGPGFQFYEHQAAVVLKAAGTKVWECADAAKYAELGDICATKGFPDQAIKGYESAMRLDKDNEKARKGLGYTKFGKVWLTKKQDEARKAASKAEVVKEPDQDQWEQTIAAK